MFLKREILIYTYKLIITKIFKSVASQAYKKIMKNYEKFSKRKNNNGW